MAQVFTSYSRKDKDFVRKLSDAFANQKRDTWIDWKDIPLTAEWQQEILTNIEGAENFLFVISPDSVTSPSCRIEIDHAVANNKRMFPIVRRRVPDDAVPEALGKFQWIDFSDDDTFEARFATLIAALDTDLAWVKVHTRLLTRAKEWEREGKDKSFLLYGKDLREAERWVAKSSEKDPKPTTLQSQYILASRQAATKLQRIVIAAVVVAFLVAMGLAVYAFIQKNFAQRETRIAQQNERESKARELAALSTESLSEDPEKSILLGMQAVNATLRFGQLALPPAEEALHQALLIDGLAKVANDAFFQSAGHDVFIGVSRDQDCGNRVALVDEAPVKLETCHCRHMNVGDQTGGVDKARGCEEIGSRREGLDAEAQ